MDELHLRNVVDRPWRDAPGASAPLSGETDVDAALDAAARAFETWRDTTPAERQLLLLQLAGAIEGRAGELVTTESRDTGTPLGLTAEEELPPGGFDGYPSVHGFEDHTRIEHATADLHS